MSPGTLYSHYSPEQSFSEHHWPWTSQCEHLQYHHYICSINQSTLFIIPVKRAMAKEDLVWRTQKKLPKLRNDHHVLQAIIFKVMEQEIADYSLNVKWSGLSGGWVSAGMMEIDHPWILQLLSSSAVGGTCSNHSSSSSPVREGKAAEPLVERLLFPQSSAKQVAPQLHSCWSVFWSSMSSKVSIFLKSQWNIKVLLRS